MSDDKDDAQDRQVGADRDGLAFLDVFGLKLEVSNPRLAELLMMDAREALTTDVRELGSVGEKARDARATAAQAAPDTLVSSGTPKDSLDEAERREFRKRTAAVGAELGFDVADGGLWRSPTGVAILTRAVERPVSLAAASHFVTELAPRVQQLAGEEAAVLFVVESSRSADVFKVAIRQRHLYDTMRVISATDLQEVARLHRAGVLDHAKSVFLLAPSASIDVGEILSVIRSSGGIE